MNSWADPATLLFQQGVSPEEAGLLAPEHSVTIDDGMRVERNVAVGLADGTRIFVDVFRPEGATDVPVLIAWGPYGKHNGASMYQQFRDESGQTGGGVRAEWVSQYATFEACDPKQWCAAQYAVINVDPRATWWSEGDYASIWDEREAHDCADLIAWAGDQPWSNGKVGMTGVSYLAIIQWFVASLQPPCLAAINPCEGLADVYREFAFHGGIPDSSFPSFWQRNRLKYSTAKVEALADMMAEHPLNDAYWATKRPDLSKVEVPAYVIASWSDQGLHTRGTLAAFEEIGSSQKFLEVHGRKKWEYYHQPSTFQRQLAFFDRFLRDQPTAVESWPRVTYELRTGYYRGVQCDADRWPLPDIGVHTLYLHAADGSLCVDFPADSSSTRYAAGADGDEAVFEHVFDTRTDVVGPARLKLWVAADGADDMDLFVGLTKLTPEGEPVHFPFANVLERGPVALGWLRASHRALDLERSTSTRPWHPHDREERLRPGEIVPVEIEIWPSGTRFEPGERLRLRVRGSDLYTEALLSKHLETRNKGLHTIHTGGEHDSQLVLPVLEGASDPHNQGAVGATTTTTEGVGPTP